MSYKLLKSATASKTNIYEKVSILDTETSDWIIFPPDVREVGVDFLPAGTAKIQTSNDIEGMRDDTAVGLDWDEGEIAIDKAATAIGVRGFRVVSISGAVDVHFNGVVG